MPILLLILFLLVPATMAGQVAVSRAAPTNSGVLFREFDLPGGKAEYCWATSVAGSPDLWLPRLGLNQPIARLPHQAAGLYADTLLWDPWLLGLNGENGILLPPRVVPLTPDTPRVHLAWERYAFSGNSLRMEFQRAFVSSVFFDLGLVTHSTDSSGSFRYQDITHQPYLGTLKRDSSQVPLSGRNLGFDDFALHPRIIWQGSRMQITTNVALLRFKNDDASRAKSVYSTTETWQLLFPEDPFSVKTRSTGIGFDISYKAFSNASISWQHQYTDLQNSWSHTPTQVFHVNRVDSTIAADTSADNLITAAHDTTWLDTVGSPVDYTQHSTQHTGMATLDLPTLSSRIELQYESRIFDQWRDAHFIDQTKQLWEDRELLHVTSQDSLQADPVSLYARLQAGAQRNSSTFDRQEIAPTLASEFRIRTPLGFELQTALRTGNRFPDAEQTQFSYSGRATWANANLLTEVRRTMDAHLAWKSTRLQAGLGITRESVLHPIRLGWTTTNQNSLPDSVAFRWMNRDSISNLAWRCSVQGQIGNWLLEMERASVLNRNQRDPENPTRTYQGAVTWTKSTVQDRLHLRMRWDFQWMGDREDFAINTLGYAERIRLPHELTLNFEARMQIQSFELYTRIDNLNHTKRRPAAGYAPEGIVFRYGIEWTLWN